MKVKHHIKTNDYDGVEDISWFHPASIFYIGLIFLVLFIIALGF